AQLAATFTEEPQGLPATGVRTVTAYEQGRQPELAGKRGDRVAFGRMDPVCAQVDTSPGPAATANSVARFEDGDRVAELGERSSRCQSGKARAEHEHAMDFFA